ncbi:MAG: GNAT family N-acetyltransferase [Thermoleophilia bacterium]
MRAISHEHAASVAEAAANGMTGLRRRAGTLAGAYRDCGVPGFAMALAGHLPGRALRVEWYGVHEVRPSAVHVTEPWPNAREAVYDDADLLAAVGHVSAAEVRGRLARGDEAFIAFDEAGEPLAYMWYRSGSWREDDVEYVLEPDERWGFDLFVRPEARGLRAGPRLVSVALVALHDRGVRRVVSVIDHLNRASLHSSMRYGSVTLTSVLTIAVPWAGVVRDRPQGARRGRWAAYRRPAGIRRRTADLPSEDR